ncbi:hypothetical protein [Streptomyces phaeoluteigriseus]|uniref:hypothetical protein n=1 Tax=Streptomyces phaeoluteigriseus TaxID=114686 RepID=UPI001301E95F|nr:hypothetical protein [Streptomyces phaeoluteigriseus]
MAMAGPPMITPLANAVISKPACETPVSGSPAVFRQQPGDDELGGSRQDVPAASTAAATADA